MYEQEFLKPIINFIKENKVNTTEVADCLSKTGALKNLRPIVNRHFVVGEISYIFGHSDTNWPIHEQLINLESGKIIFIDCTNIKERALFGELVASFMFKKLNAIAVITNGLVRDAGELINLGYPIWCNGFTPEGCYNIKRDLTPDIDILVKKRKDFLEGSIAVCDDCGVVIIPKKDINKYMYSKLIAIEEQEKTWFDCVLNRDWNTFDTVCLKKYQD